MIEPMKYDSFGHTYNKKVFNRFGVPQRHSGIDLNLGRGTDDLNDPIWSPLDGKVIFSARAGSWGHMIVIRHDLPTPFEYRGKTYSVVWSRQAHMQKRIAMLDDLVKEGQQIGTCGGTGRFNRSYSPHDHFDIILQHLGKWTSYTSWWSAAKTEQYYADPLKFIWLYNQFLEDLKKKDDKDILRREQELDALWAKFKRTGLVKKDIRRQKLMSFGDFAEIYFRMNPQK